METICADYFENDGQNLLPLFFMRCSGLILLNKRAKFVDSLLFFVRVDDLLMLLKLHGDVISLFLRVDFVEQIDHHDIPVAQLNGQHLSSVLIKDLDSSNNIDIIILFLIKQMMMSLSCILLDKFSLFASALNLLIDILPLSDVVEFLSLIVELKEVHVAVFGTSNKSKFK